MFLIPPPPPCAVVIMLRVLKEFEQLPDHLTQEPHVFSMDDLLRVKRGQLVPLARAVLRVAIDHVESCQVYPPVAKSLMDK